MKKITRIRKDSNRFPLVKTLLLGLLLLSKFGFASKGANGLDQKVSVQIVDQPISHLLDVLENKTPLHFIYSQNKVDLSQRITDSYTDQMVKEILDEALPQHIGYSISGNNIILVSRPKKEQTKGKGRVIGSITDATDGSPLSFASVVIEGSSRAVIADENGNFSMSGVPAGPIVLLVKFVGYTTGRIETEVVANETVKVSAQLNSAFEDLEGVTVTGMRRGEVKALTEMKTAENIKYVLSQEQMERFPDLTLSESLQRVPGVAVGYSYGVPRDIIIRGLSQDLSSVTLNGNRLPSNGTKDRGTNLNSVLSNSVASIEVIKTLTPDRDADGTGGTVNIVTKTPGIDSKIMEAKVAGGFNGLIDKMNYDLGFTYGQRKDKFGFLIGANYSKSYRGEDRVEKEYDGFDIGDNEVELLETLELSGHILDRDNLGINTELNYYPNDNSSFYFRANYNKYYEIQDRYRQSFNIREYASVGNASEIRVYNYGNARDYNRDLLVFSLGGKTHWGVFDTEFDLTYNHGSYDQPISYGTTFVRSDLSGSLDLSDPKAPKINFDQANPMDPTQYRTNQYVDRHDTSVDNDFQATVNLSTPYTLGTANGTFKFGGRFRYKFNDRFRNYKLFNLAEGDFVLTDFLSDYEKDDLYDGNYRIYNFPNTYAMNDYFNANSDLFVQNETYTRQNTDPDSYEGNEFFNAAYVMTKLDWGKLEAIAGLRYEGTRVKYDGNQVILDEDGNYVDTFKVDTDESFHGFFPSLNLKYTLGENTVVRGAITRSLVRPNYYDLVPWQEVEARRERIKKGNPDLTQATAINYDILFEHYIKPVGLISGGVFYKSIKDYIYSSRFTQEGGEFHGWRIYQEQNGADATAKGFELSWQQQLTFLPGFLNGFGLFANYTYVDSEFTVPGVETDRTVKLPEMRPHVGNVSLSYEKYGFSGRVSMYFYDTFISELGEVAAEDEIEVGRHQIDISAEQRIGKGWSVFMGISNITNAPISFEFGDGKPLDDRYYGTWGNLGLRYQLN